MKDEPRDRHYDSAVDMPDDDREAEPADELPAGRYHIDVHSDFATPAFHGDEHHDSRTDDPGPYDFGTGELEQLDDHEDGPHADAPHIDAHADGPADQLAEAFEPTGRRLFFDGYNSDPGPWGRFVERLRRRRKKARVELGPVGSGGSWFDFDEDLGDGGDRE